MTLFIKLLSLYATFTTYSEITSSAVRKDEWETDL
jgi:hypothetical protein